jgi:hypothetical protein
VGGEKRNLFNIACPVAPADGTGVNNVTKFSVSQKVELVTYLPASLWKNGFIKTIRI